MARRDGGLTLLEVAVALAVLATGVLAVQRLLVRSVDTIAADARLTRAMLHARRLLAEAAVSPPPLGRRAGAVGDEGNEGFRFEREVRATAHPGLREIRVRVSWPGGDPAACELVELVRVPAV
jgi:type II secretion system protein I